MAKLGYQWYPKDWSYSDKVFELNLSERGLYRELIDSAMTNDNKQKFSVRTWARKFNSNEEEINIIIDRLVELGLVEIKNDLLFIESCEPRLNLVRGGKKGGEKSTKNKPIDKPTGKPIVKPDPNQKKEKENKDNTKAALNIEVDLDNTPKFQENLKKDINKYEESKFLENWAKCRDYFLQQPTHIPKLNGMEKADFRAALKDFTEKEINLAMYGLFKQENITFNSMTLRPKHFLERVDVYLAAEKSKDYKLYGSKKVSQ